MIIGQSLPAYTQDGIVLSRDFCSSTDSTVFEHLIAMLLLHRGRWPEPKSVLILDNASFHHLDRLDQICADAGVKFTYLLPHLPDLNPIK